jgi:hypothetical protein
MVMHDERKRRAEHEASSQLKGISSVTVGRAKTRGSGISDEAQIEGAEHQSDSAYYWFVVVRLHYCCS